MMDPTKKAELVKVFTDYMKSKCEGVPSPITLQHICEMVGADINGLTAYLSTIHAMSTAGLIPPGEEGIVTLGIGIHLGILYGRETNKVSGVVN